jgi:hypothetical protein
MDHGLLLYFFLVFVWGKWRCVFEALLLLLGPWDIIHGLSLVASKWRIKLLEVNWILIDAAELGR